MDASANLQLETIYLPVPGGEQIEVTYYDIDTWAQYGMRICINYASQVGASVILLVALCILTQAEKRKSPVFLLNSGTLLLNIIRTILQLLYFTGPFNMAYYFFSGDPSVITSSAKSTSVAAIVFTFFEVITIEASLVLQVRAVCVTAPRVWRAILLALSTVIALLAICWRLALTILNAQRIFDLADPTDLRWLVITSLYTVTASICFFSAVFTGKLIHTILARRKMGLVRFGPMQVISIMGFQTLIVPAIFSLLQLVQSVPELGSQVLTIVALFLPLSALWAAKSISDGRPQPSAINSKGKNGFLGWFSTRAGIGGSSNTSRSKEVSTKNESLTSTNSNKTDRDDYKLFRDVDIMEKGSVD